MDPIRRHAEKMSNGPPGLGREVARELLLQQSGHLEVLVIYDYPADALMVFKFQPDPMTLAYLMDCHNKYVGANELKPEFKEFIEAFPERFQEHKVIDNTEPDSKWLGLTNPISFVFVMGNFDREKQSQAL